MNDPFAAFGSLMARLRWVVVVAWLAVLVVAGGTLAPKAAKALQSGGFFVPDSESSRAAATFDREFSSANRNTATVVFRSATQTVDDPAFRAEAVEAERRIQGIAGVRQIESYFQTGNPLLVGTDRRSAISLITLDGTEGQVQERALEIRHALEGVALEHFVTGQPAINADVRISSEEDLRRAELITLPVIAVLLLLVFGTVAGASIPLALGAASVTLAMAALYLLTFRTDISIFALNTATMIGLGLAIDFSLIVVSRFHEELDAGRSPMDAVAATMATAGRSITYSGVTVMLGMLLLTVLFDLLVVRSMSLAVMLVAGTALLSGLTLLPALLAIMGHRINWLRVVPRGRRETGQSGVWYRLSHAIMRRPLLWMTVAVGALVVLALPARNLRLMGVAPGALPQEAESVRGAIVMTETLGPNRLEPIQIVVRAGEPNGVWTPAFLTGLQRLTAAIGADARTDQVLSLATAAQAVGLPPNQFTALNPSLLRADPLRARQAARLVNLNGDNDAATITVFVKHGAFDQRHLDFVRDLRETIIPGIPELSRYEVQVGGLGAGFSDYTRALYDRFPLLVAAVMAMTFLILMMFFRSVVLPVKAILLNVASILATYGALALIFQRGLGAEALAFEPQGALFVTTPAVLFVILFGMSTDYEVFMLSRVKELFHETGDNEEAVAAGLQHTARVITAAGLVLVGTFASFGASRILVLKELGLGLAIGVLLDATIVRLVLVPASMRLMGSANWWMPGWLSRIVPELREGPAVARAMAPATPAAAPARRRRGQWLALAGLGVVVAAGAGFVGCRRAGEAAPPAAPLPTLEITAHDASYSAPDLIPAGRRAITLRNGGTQLRNAQLMRVKDGVSLPELAAAFRQGTDTALRMVNFAGGPGTVLPGGEQEVVQDLKEGQYVMVTLLHDEAGQQVTPQGMVKPFQVVGAAPRAERAERSDGRLVFTDFAFSLPRIRPGERVLEVVNEGVQPHEVLFKRLKTGATLNDARAYALRPAGPAPYEDAGGLLMVERGERAWMKVDMAPGSYVALCYFPDPNSGKTHIELGMINQFTVS
ncbi:MAG TPA: MMPL family transporter [Chloroflexota bacterium]|nr:MMPL family transporter [Chloroflexota bacterium]